MHICLSTGHLRFKCEETWEKPSLWKIRFSRTVGPLSNEKNPRCSKEPHFPYPHSGISRSARSNFGRDTGCSRVGFAACSPAIILSGDTAHGDGSAVILLPAFLCPDAYLTPLHQWLARIGYNPFFSGIGFNTECPNLLIKKQLNATIEKALAKSGRKVHLVGHSLGGIIARALAAQRPSDVASVITLGAPFRGTVAHSSILHAAEMVRRRIHAKHGSGVLRDCYTGHCACDFLNSLRHAMPASVAETAVYSEGDGVVDWRYCKTDRAESDFSVSGTHLGLVFNPSVYGIVAERLAKAG